MCVNKVVEQREREREREREMNTNLSSFLFSIAVLLGLLGVCHGGKLRKNFYEDSCPLAEDTVKEIIWKHVACNSTLPAKFLRMHFHDCFVRVIHISLSLFMNYVSLYHSCPKVNFMFL